MLGKTEIKLLCLIGLFSLVAASCGGGEDSNGDGAGTTERRDLPVGMTLELPPQVFVDENGDPTGFEYEMLLAATDELGYDVSVERTPFEQAFVGLAADKYDMFVGGIYIRCERLDGTEAELEFSVPLYEEGQVITTTQDRAAEIQSLEDLDGLTVAIEAKGSTADALTDSFLEENPDVDFKKEFYSNVNDAVIALNQGRADAMVQASIITLDAIKEAPNLVVSGEVPDSAYPVGFVFTPGDPLKEEFNDALNELKSSGALADIWEKWFNVRPEDGTPTVEQVPEVGMDTCKTA